MNSRCPEPLEEALLGYASRHELPESLREHLEQCPRCAELAADWFLLERRLRGLASAPMPALDLSAAVMARLPVAARAPERLPLAAWTPLLLLALLLVPDPAGFPDLLAGLAGLSWPRLPALPWPQLSLPRPAPAVLEASSWLLALAALTATWKWRGYARL